MIKEMPENCEHCEKAFSNKEKRLTPCLHHIDGNHGNNDFENQMWMHFGCHRSIHMNGNQYRKGVHLSEEAKKKLSTFAKTRTGDKNSMFGRCHLEETKKKISKAMKGSQNHNYGKSFSKETKEKMSISHQLNWMVEKYLSGT